MKSIDEKFEEFSQSRPKNHQEETWKLFYEKLDRDYAAYVEQRRQEKESDK